MWDNAKARLVLLRSVHDAPNHSLPNAPTSPLLPPISNAAAPQWNYLLPKVKLYLQRSSLHAAAKQYLFFFARTWSRIYSTKILLGWVKWTFCVFQIQMFNLFGLVYGGVLGMAPTILGVSKLNFAPEIFAMVDKRIAYGWSENSPLWPLGVPKLKLALAA